ncbi:MAG: putative membrane protein [Candidatus Azotimanducaceae bacterium]
MNNSKWLKLVLIISLALNLLIAGVVIGRVMDGGGPPGMHLRWAISELDAPAREKLGASMRDHFKETRPLRKTLRQAQRRLSDAVSLEPFDHGASADAFAEVRAASQALQISIHKKMLENLSQLGTKERQQVFQAFIRRDASAPKGPHRERAPQEP